MKLIEVKDYQEMSRRAAEFIIEKVRNAHAINLGLATGGTPVGTYQCLVEDHKKNLTSYKNVTTFNLDEYVGLSGKNPNSYRYYMNENLFNHIDIDASHTHIPQGNAEDLEKECIFYEQEIERHGGIDLQVLGIGSNGHIGFNEPGTSFNTGTHIVDLAPSTREANARYFASQEEVPSKAITMGISTILKSKEILLLVSGERKQEALVKLFEGEVDERFPASVLKNHPCVTIIADEAAIPEKVRN
ncbi:glucosamine-6-phosphate deaminase [Bacillus salacetis]|uniref:Glucosamine-6-phosphate deaminase n=1 Tax=Bacillus salacetis TaxID=2315464 RepID=A0A3A1R2C8_9BACI|nr:glucosamine-6-phosphate deaminase [Bacillus salacetis]RIW34662.1 glucosamine-6-phosphate deaminase [Bacillus salacetis]